MVSIADNTYSMKNAKEVCFEKIIPPCNTEAQLVKFVKMDSSDKISIPTRLILKVHLHNCLKWGKDEQWIFWRWTHKLKNVKNIVFIWTLGTLEKLHSKIHFTRDQYIVIHHAIIRFKSVRIDPKILTALYGTSLDILKAAQKKEKKREKREKRKEKKTFIY